MISNRDITLLVDSYLGNPFSGDEKTRRAAAELLGRLDVGAVLESLVRQRDLDRAKDLLLAAGHHQACRSTDPAGCLDESTLPPSVERALPRPRRDYLRVVMAAGRCFQSLSRLRGSSELMLRARRETWAACFGDSLRHALDLERIIRDHDVLILGETGTGKELFAHAIQMATPGGADGGPPPRSAINAAAIPDTLVESELFGHVKGAFTGATETRAGRIRSADGGIFFLDEVGDLPTTTQVKLLRVIETNEVYPLGSDAAHSVDLRYVAATHKDLAAMVERGEFRRDLYERMAGIVLRIAPLRERADDIVDIGRYFIETSAASLGRIRNREAIEAWLVSAEARNHSWPGNVRELQNALRNLMLGLAPGVRDDPPEPHPAETDASLPAPIRAAAASLQDVSDWYMREVLARTGSNYTRAAQILGIDRSTVRRRIRVLARSRR